MDSVPTYRKLSNTSVRGVPLECELQVVVTSSWTGIITAVATTAAVFVALGLHFHRLYKDDQDAKAQSEKSATVALQAAYSEIRALDAYFGLVKLNLHDLRDPAAVDVLLTIADPDSHLDPDLPVVIVESRMEVVSRLPKSLSGVYAGAMARYRIVRDHSKRLVNHCNGSREELIEDQSKGCNVANFFRVAAFIRKAATEGEEYTGLLIAEAEERDPDLKPVRVSGKEVLDEASLHEVDTP